jgi:serine/threonine-protein kinase
MMLPAEGLGDGVNLDEMQARFLREAKAAARIQSRHVASVLHFGQDVNDEGETIAYIVMEFLKGKRLDKVINRDGPLSPSRAVHIGTQIAKGMAAAHDLGIVHRDLKPANIMLVEEEGDPDFVKILDFGVAKLTHDQQTHALTQAGAFLGTLAFMAPEQVSGGEVDARADIYSLGIILYRMFTGVPVWDADSLSDIVRHQLSSRPPSMAERVAAPLFTAAHDAVVLRCLEKAPAARYQTMLDLAAALRAAEDAPSAMVGGTVATVAASTPPTTGTPSRERHGDGMDTSPTSPGTNPTGADRGWTVGLSEGSASATTVTDDDSVFAAGSSQARVIAVSPTTAPPPAPAPPPTGLDMPRTAAPPVSPSPRPLGLVIGLIAAAAVGGIILASVLGRSPAPPPATTASAASRTPPSPPPPPAPVPEPSPATPPPEPLPPVPASATTTAPPTTTPTPPPPTRASTKPTATRPAPTRPAPDPEPPIGFKRVHTRGTSP